MWFNTLCEESCLNVGYLTSNIPLLNNFAGTEFGKLLILKVIELQKFLICSISLAIRRKYIKDCQIKLTIFNFFG